MPTKQELERYERMPLHEILTLPEGPQTDALRWFMDNPAIDTVLIKSNSGSRMTVKMGGKTLNIMPKGLRVSKRMAINLLLAYGYRGKYQGRERYTGLRKIDIQRMPDETKERVNFYNPEPIDWKNFNPSEDYLVQASTVDELDELGELIAAQEAQDALRDEHLVTATS